MLPDILIFSETEVLGSRCYSTIQKLGYSACDYVEGEEFAGGIWMASR